jgi:hypothetical protein
VDTTRLVFVKIKENRVVVNSRRTGWSTKSKESQIRVFSKQMARGFKLKEMLGRVLQKRLWEELKGCMQG